MGSALMGGMLKAGVVSPDRLTATVKSESHALELAANYGVRVTAGASGEAARDADLVILAVKPGTVPSVLKEIAGELHEGQIILSVVEEGATAVCSNSAATESQRELVESIFRAVGVVCFVEEETMDAVTALSGSGPA